MEFSPQRRRLITDTGAILHPGEVQRPFRTDETEPDWLAEELRPPALDCEARTARARAAASILAPGLKFGASASFAVPVLPR